MDLDTIYRVPLAYHEVGLDTQLLKVFGIENAPPPDLSRWQRVVERVKNPEGEVRIAVVGKYMQVKDSYKSLSEALTHGGLANNVQGASGLDRQRSVRARGRRGVPGECRRHPGARRFRRARHRRQDRAR